MILKKIIVIVLFALSIVGFTSQETLASTNKPGTFKLSMKIPGYYYIGKPRITQGSDFKESKWILKKKNSDITLQLIIRVEIIHSDLFFVLVAVDNANGVNKYRGIFHHYKHDYADNIWIYKKVKSGWKNNPGKFLLTQRFIDPKNIPLYCKELITLTYSKNIGTENIVGGFKTNVNSKAVKKWLLRAVKFIEKAITRNKNKNQ